MGTDEGSFCWESVAQFTCTGKELMQVAVGAEGEKSVENTERVRDTKVKPQRMADKDKTGNQ